MTKKPINRCVQDIHYLNDNGPSSYCSDMIFASNGNGQYEYGVSAPYSCSVALDYLSPPNTNEIPYGNQALDQVQQDLGGRPADLADQYTFCIENNANTKYNQDMAAGGQRAQNAGANWSAAISSLIQGVSSVISSNGGKTNATHVPQNSTGGNKQDTQNQKDNTNKYLIAGGIGLGAILLTTIIVIAVKK